MLMKVVAALTSRQVEVRDVLAAPRPALHQSPGDCRQPEGYSRINSRALPRATPAARRDSARPERLADEVVKRSAAQPRGGSRVSACRPMTRRFLRGLRTNRRHDSEVMGQISRDLAGSQFESQFAPVRRHTGRCCRCSTRTQPARQRTLAPVRTDARIT
jgi:hypothetical protein